MENKQIIGAVTIGLLILLITLFIFQSNQGAGETGSDLLNLDLSKKQQEAPAQDITELKTQDVKAGSGSAEVESGDSITLHYAGFLTNGQKFDSSYDRKQPFTVQIGAGKLIPGFDQGVLKMKIGGKRKIFIPSEFGYGQTGQGSIPPNADLIFEVELLDIKKKEPAPTQIPIVPPETGPNPEPVEENNPENSEPTPEVPTETPPTENPEQ